MSDAQAMAELSRQIAALQVGMEGIAKNATSAAADAREARDTALVLKATVEGQNIPDRLDALKAQAVQDKADAAKALADLRADLVHAINTVKGDQKVINEASAADYENLTKRVELLETDRAKALGVAQFFGWLARVAPWLLSGVAAFAAGVGLKDKFGG